mmetsp:Transcript_37687/g.104940  ORF Transcript_37687/g.104940 Transcript_37687/m.104940 type:complete len:204 (-) Transcript_37687:628-1239(-)
MDSQGRLGVMQPDEGPRARFPLARGLRGGPAVALGRRGEERALAGALLGPTGLGPVAGVRALEGKWAHVVLDQHEHLVQAARPAQMACCNIALLKDEHVHDECRVRLFNEGIGFVLAELQIVQGCTVVLLEGLQFCGRRTYVRKVVEGGAATLLELVRLRCSPCQNLSATEVAQVASVGVSQEQDWLLLRYLPQTLNILSCGP